jgi:hypothetical protein
MHLIDLYGSFPDNQLPDLTGKPKPKRQYAIRKNCTIAQITAI